MCEAATELDTGDMEYAGLSHTPTPPLSRAIRLCLVSSIAEKIIMILSIAESNTEKKRIRSNNSKREIEINLLSSLPSSPPSPTLVP